MTFWIKFVCLIQFLCAVKQIVLSVGTVMARVLLQVWAFGQMRTVNQL